MMTIRHKGHELLFYRSELDQLLHGEYNGKELLASNVSELYDLFYSEINKL